MTIAMPVPSTGIPMYRLGAGWYGDHEDESECEGKHSCFGLGKVPPFGGVF